MSAAERNSRALAIKNKLLAQGETEESIQAIIRSTQKKVANVLQKKRAMNFPQPVMVGMQSDQTRVPMLDRGVPTQTNPDVTRIPQYSAQNPDFTAPNRFVTSDFVSYEDFLARERERIQSNYTPSRFSDASSILSSKAPSLSFSVASRDSVSSLASAASSVFNQATNSASGLFGRLKGGFDYYNAPLAPTKTFNPFQDTRYGATTF